MAGKTVIYPISNMSLRGEKAEFVFNVFHKIAADECSFVQVKAFEKIVLEAAEKRGIKPTK